MTVAPLPTSTPGPTPTLAPTNTPLPLFMDSDMLTQMVQQVRPAVVRILAPNATGSGVIFEADGREAYILTNEHVVGRASTVTVVVNDNTSYTATPLGQDPQRDLAVLKICCGTFTALPFGVESDLQSGLQVVNMGYPLNLPGEATVTTGIISAIRYDSAGARWEVQTDAAINPGNSGGPMLSTDGRILGINTRKIDSTRSGRDAEGLGFAVSIKTVLVQLERLKGAPYTARQTPTATPIPRPTFTPTPSPLEKFIEQERQRLQTATPTRRPTMRPTSTLTPTLRPTPTIGTSGITLGPVNGVLKMLDTTQPASTIYGLLDRW